MANQTEALVVFRARSSARFRPESGLELNISAPSLNVADVRLRIFTRWVSIGGKDIPRELIVEARGLTDSINDALAKFGSIARPLATTVGFVANVRVGQLEEHIAYECGGSTTERQFLEVFLPDEKGSLSPGAAVPVHLLDATCRAIIEFRSGYPRLDRALRQYELALREWRVGGEWLALSHLWIAAENLTTLVIRKLLAERGVNQEQLAQSYEIVTDDPCRPRWISLLGARIRQNHIFAGDNETYQLAKDASDGLEHGYLTLDKVAKKALKCADKTFAYVRRSIVALLDLPAEVADELNAIPLRDVQSMRKVARGRLIGSADNPAIDGELYPRLEWTSSVDSSERDGDTFKFRVSENMTVRTNPSVAFQLDRFEVHGRLEAGAAEVQLSQQDVQLTHTPASPWDSLLAAVMPLVEAAAASGIDKPHNQASAFAFNLLGQALSYFKGSELLIRANQPVEALPLFRALTILAARFEQMDSMDGPGLAIAARMALDSLQNSGGDTDVIAARTAVIRHHIATLGLSIPDSLSPIESTAIYEALQVEMRIASQIGNNSYFAVGPHLQGSDSEHAMFNIAVESGPFTNLVASATVISTLTLTKHAATLFEWTINGTRLDAVLEHARTLNSASASGEDPPPAFV